MIDVIYWVVLTLWLAQLARVLIKLNYYWRSTPHLEAQVRALPLRFRNYKLPDAISNGDRTLLREFHRWFKRNFYCYLGIPVLVVFVAMAGIAISNFFT